MSQKTPAPKNVIYDTGAERSTGRKHSAEVTGGLSVSERARLFGAQIKPGSGSNNFKSAATTKNHKPLVQQKIPWPPPERPSDIVSDETEDESSKRESHPRPKSDTFYSTSHGISHKQQLFSQINDRSTRQPIPPNDSRQFSKKNRPHQHHHKHSTSPSRHQSHPTYDSLQSHSSSKHSRRVPRESYTTDEESYYNPNEKPKSHSSRNTANYSSSANYFQPIRDPLEVLYSNASQEYIYQPRPVTFEADNTDLQPFDLGNLISRIQHDYISNVQPYVSSVEYIGYNQNLANLNILTSGDSRENYTRRPDNRYQQFQSSNQYDVVNRNGYEKYKKPRPKQSLHSKQHSSTKRRKHRARLHDQASSPIHVVEAPNKNPKKEVPIKPPTPPPPPPPPKVPTPVPSSSSEEATVKDPSSESSSEDEAPAPVPVVTPALPRPTVVPLALPPPKVEETSSSESETEESESEDSDSDSSSESEKDKKKSNPKLATSTTNLRTAPGTPRINNPTPVANPPAEPSASVKSFDTQETKKTSTIGGKFKSITNKFRRK